MTLDEYQRDVLCFAVRDMSQALAWSGGTLAGILAACQVLPMRVFRAPTQI